jgi:pyridoxamine 5'-phosphate oxidase
MATKKISEIRDVYSKGVLERETLNHDPLKQLEIWLQQAIDSGHPEPSAMHLSTVDAIHRPHARIVLLKGVEQDGLVFYTNYRSDKAIQIAQNPQVSLLFFWPLLERQVRVEGRATKVSDETSDAYFADRPRESQLGAWASPQSRVVGSQNELNQMFSATVERFQGQTVPRPPHWGGYRVVAERIEFWQGQPGRMHHRYRYSREVNDWKVEQLAP